MYLIEKSDITMQDIETLIKQASDQIQNAANLGLLDEIRVRYLGKKGLLTEQMKSLGQLEPQQRKEAGKRLNQAKQQVQDFIKDRQESLQAQSRQAELAAETVDVTLPGVDLSIGNMHPISRTRRRVEQFFVSAGFDLAQGPEVEDDYHNFGALNMPDHHPARDMQDTFYFANNLLLRTHTSSVQIRQMEKSKPPFRLIASGRVYRSDSPDLTHTPMFHQIEGLMVDENISFTHLKGILTEFLQSFFGKALQTRFRPSYFPFTEPSAEVDIECVSCEGNGCRICSHTGWLEILGCGMVHPNVFSSVGVDTERYTGFAFGIGIERLAMLHYGITDCRSFYENDLRFIQQF